jgi:hypothetical protein
MLIVRSCHFRDKTTPMIVGNTTIGIVVKINLLII